ncbi:S8 family serine peptidase [Brassicibacter mesophilus]|uniref:S8 family serine peptidase n=1 Tax=Brassicibacter mesophilus TaxID=745119 RepID=UPI003D25369F
MSFFVKKTKESIAVFVLLLLLFNSFAVFATTDNVMNIGNDGESLAREELANDSLEKIDPEVIESFSDDSYVDVIVYLEQQVDTEKVAMTTTKNKLTGYQMQIEARKAVVDVLRDTAEDTQQNLLKYLEQEKLNNTVEDFKPYYIINAIYVKAKEEVIKNIAKMEEVKDIRINQKIEISTLGTPTPNAISYDDSNKTEWNIEKINADRVWNELGIDGSGIVVGVIDTGVHWEHEALKNKWRGYNPNQPERSNPIGNWFDAVAGKSMPYDEAGNPHGTHVTGTILGQDANGENKIGVAPGAKWIAARAFVKDVGYQNWILSAGEWMLAPNGDPSLAPDIINNSWGGAFGDDEWYRDMVKNWRAAGILPVFAAGNAERVAQEGSITVPASYPESFAVAAVSATNRLAAFSKRGPSSYGEEIKPEISAPGVNIRSSIPGGYAGGWNGTSMAAPHVTGTVALLLSANSSLTVEELEDILIDTATPLTDRKYKETPNCGYGYGLVDAYAAVSSITEGKGRGTIQGKILANSTDKENPTITHEPIKKAFEGLETLIEANIQDDVSVINVELMIKSEDSLEWVAIPMEKKSGGYKNGTYSATIPIEYVKQSGFEYKISAVDYANNVSETEEYPVNIVFGIVPGEYETDFSEFPLGWKLEGDWEWGDSFTNPIAHSKTKLLGTKLAENYSSDTVSILKTPPIDLRNSDLKHAILRFYHWFQIETYDDIGRILITNDNGQTWKQAKINYTGFNKMYWDELAIDLSEYIGSENPVLVAFQLTTDKSSEYLGWYIDDVRLISEDTQAPRKIEGLTSEIYPAGVVLGWDKPIDGDIAAYKIYRTTNEDNELELIGESSSTHYIDNDTQEGQTYYYQITAYDLAGNEGDKSDISIMEVDSLPEVLYYSNFEENDGGFTSGGDNSTWEWGSPISGPAGKGEDPSRDSTTNGEAFTGTNVWATNLSGIYLDDSNSWIESPEIIIPDTGAANLSFYHWYDTDYSDKCKITVSQQVYGEWSEWNDLGVSYYNIGWGWKPESIDLSEYQGDTIKLRFNLTSNDYISYGGWYIDDVVISVNSENGDISAIGDSLVSEGLDSVTDDVYGTNETKTNIYKYNIEESRYNSLASLSSIENTYVTGLSEEQLEEGAVENKAGIPVDASITVLETGVSVRASLIDGSYTLKYPIDGASEDLTLRVEAYGYYPQELQIHLEDEQILIQDFYLEPIPKGSIKGKIISKATGSPVEGATIRIKEDSRVQPVSSDINGNFVIEDINEGEYTIRVIANDYCTEEIKVSVSEDTTQTLGITLKRFANFLGEIAYDDGSAERGIVAQNKNSGVALKVTPAEIGKLNGVNIYFWDESWPTPGGDRIGFAIYDIKENGELGEQINGPIMTDIERGKWNYVDLSSMNFTTDKEFFIATVQDAVGLYMPGIGVDDNSINGRSFIHHEGVLYPIVEHTSKDGTLMMRPVMSYVIDTPQITNLSGLSYTDKDVIVLEGTINRDSSIVFYNNGEKIKEVTVLDNKFSSEIELAEGENKITVTGFREGKETEPSDPIIVVKDTAAPIIELLEPKNNLKTDQKLVHIIGNVKDYTLDKVKINEEIINIDDEGDFDYQIDLNNGKNVITVYASDLMGNETVLTRTVYLDPDLSKGSGSSSSSAHKKTLDKYIIEVTVPISGDTVKDKKGSIEFVFEKGAFDKRVEVKVEVLDDEDIEEPKTSHNIKRVADVYEFTSSIDKFNKPVKVKMKYNKSKLDCIDEELLGVYTLNEKTDTWEYVGGKVDKKNRVVEVELNHFSKYTIMASTRTFADIANHWAKHNIEAMAARKIVDGMDGVNYVPQGTMTKAQFVKTLASLLGLEQEEHTGVFTDIAGRWYTGYVEAALKAGIITATENTFNPDAAITREEMAVMIANTIKYVDETKATAVELTFEDKDQIAESAKEAVAIAFNNGIINGRTETTFIPKGTATRAEAATMIYRLLQTLDKL